MYRFHSSMVELPHSIRGGPGSIPGWCSSIFGIWREVLRCNVYITSQHFFPAIIYRDIISHITSTYRYIMYFFRTFKKSTAPYKVHNMGLRYIKMRKKGGNRTGKGGVRRLVIKGEDGWGRKSFWDKVLITKDRERNTEEDLKRWSKKIEKKG